MTIIFTASNTENLNTMVNAFDKSFRSMWNTFGGKRVASWKENDLLKVEMTYTGNEFFFTFADLLEEANRRLCRNKIFNEELDTMYFEKV